MSGSVSCRNPATASKLGKRPCACPSRVCIRRALALACSKQLKRYWTADPWRVPGTDSARGRLQIPCAIFVQVCKSCWQISTVVTIGDILLFFWREIHFLKKYQFSIHFFKVRRARTSTLPLRTACFARRVEAEGGGKAEGAEQKRLHQGREEKRKGQGLQSKKVHLQKLWQRVQEVELEYERSLSA